MIFKRNVKRKRKQELARAGKATSGLLDTRERNLIFQRVKRLPRG